MTHAACPKTHVVETLAYLQISKSIRPKLRLVTWDRPVNTRLVKWRLTSLTSGLVPVGRTSKVISSRQVRPQLLVVLWPTPSQVPGPCKPCSLYICHSHPLLILHCWCFRIPTQRNSSAPSQVHSAPHKRSIESCQNDSTGHWCGVLHKRPWYGSASSFSRCRG